MYERSVEYDQRGNLVSKSCYKNKKLHGKRYSYFNDGKISHITHHKNGILVGKSYGYKAVRMADGKLRQRIEIINYNNLAKPKSIKVYYPYYKKVTFQCEFVDEYTERGTVGDVIARPLYLLSTDARIEYTGYRVSNNTAKVKNYKVTDASNKLVYESVPDQEYPMRSGIYTNVENGKAVTFMPPRDNIYFNDYKIVRTDVLSPTGHADPIIIKVPTNHIVTAANDPDAEIYGYLLTARRRIDASSLNSWAYYSFENGWLSRSNDSTTYDLNKEMDSYNSSTGMFCILPLNIIDFMGVYKNIFCSSWGIDPATNNSVQFRLTKVKLNMMDTQRKIAPQIEPDCLFPILRSYKIKTTNEYIDDIFNN